MPNYDNRPYATTDLQHVRNDAEFVHRLIMRGVLNYQDRMAAISTMNILYKGMECRANLVQLNHARYVVDHLRDTYDKCNDVMEACYE